MFYIIDTEQQLQQLIDANNKKAFLHVIYDDNNNHSYIAEPVLIYYRPLNDSKGYLISLKHQDAFLIKYSKVLELVDKTSYIFVLNKKNTLYHFNTSNLIDIELLYNFKTNNVLETLQPKNPNGYVLPISKHYEYCEQLFEQVKDITNLKINDFYNNIVIPELYNIESQGIKINIDEFNKHFTPKSHKYNIQNDIIYTQYDICTTTSRPSNSFNNVNFAALTKDDGTRNSFIPKNDYFLEFDYDAYHLRLLAWLCDYEFVEPVVHNELAKGYFNTNNINEAQYQKSKTISFRQLYGGIEKKYLKIPFFKAAQEFTEQIWSEFNFQGYIKTINGKMFYKEHLQNMTPAKLLNYYIQSVETARNITKIKKLNELLENTITKLVIYNYDAFVFDVCKDEEHIIKDIKHILHSKKFPTKQKQGITLNF